ncbi:hypothetical protein HMPREF9550_03499 [Escherichia coli MS 187-1]|nr:hypothetical protein HMPREF9550_03499 [Escherichia coli MS 187-1]
MLPGFLVFGHLLINSFHLLYECFLPPSRDKYHHSQYVIQFILQRKRFPIFINRILSL